MCICVMQQYATYDTYNPPEEAAEGRAEARSGSFGTTCIYTCMNFPGAAHRPSEAAWQGTYYLLTAKGVPVDPVEVNPPPPPAPGRRAAWDLLELPAHSKRWCPG